MGFMAEAPDDKISFLGCYFHFLRRRQFVLHLSSNITNFLLKLKHSLALYIWQSVSYTHFSVIYKYTNRIEQSTTMCSTWKASCHLVLKLGPKCLTAANALAFSGHV